MNMKISNNSQSLHQTISMLIVTKDRSINNHQNQSSPILILKFYHRI